MKIIWSAWVAQLVEHPTLAQVMISQFVFEPHVRLCADSTEPGACFKFCVSLSFCPSPAHALSLSVSKINKNILKIKKNKKTNLGGACVAQWVERPTLAQVMISRCVSLSPTLGSVLTA